MSTFNTHGNRTDSGTVITAGMPVLDYDRREGIVVEDRDQGSARCEGGFCGGDHWFDVEHADGSRSMMNGTRLHPLAAVPADLSARYFDLLRARQEEADAAAQAAPVHHTDPATPHPVTIADLDDDSATNAGILGADCLGCCYGIEADAPAGSVFCSDCLADSDGLTVEVDGDLDAFDALALVDRLGREAEATARATGSTGATVRQETRLADGTLRVDAVVTWTRALDAASRVAQPVPFGPALPSVRGLLDEPVSCDWCEVAAAVVVVTATGEVDRACISHGYNWFGITGLDAAAAERAGRISRPCGLPVVFPPAAQAAQASEAWLSATLGGLAERAQAERDAEHAAQVEA